MNFGTDINEFLKSSAKRALRGNTPKSLRKASIELNDKEVQWLCVLDLSATEDDVKNCAVAGTEIIADFTWEYGINQMFEKTQPNEKPRALKNIVYQRLERNFKERDLEEQEWISENNYCVKCKKADTGLNYPIEYEFDEKIYVDGICKLCGTSCSTEIKIETE
ncbi:hypothetical protein [Pseudotamlana agarivorans]|uniref:hypothetical protein n=1 Tax=Pseudotamlana agarivorans TaxID=481183 RepID=UPI00082DA4B0|nr:hypothetical protein [Tamlana agarivorans]